MELPPTERLMLADEIYRSIDLAGSDDLISPEILAEMERRDTEHENNPASGCSVEELEKRLFSRQ